jgi:hypothetical protein
MAIKIDIQGIISEFMNFNLSEYCYPLAVAQSV